MLKTILICTLLLSVFASHVRKTHKALHNKKVRMFNSAFFEFQSLGEKDYHLSFKEACKFQEISIIYNIGLKLQVTWRVPIKSTNPQQKHILNTFLELLRMQMTFQRIQVYIPTKPKVQMEIFLQQKFEIIQLIN